MPTNSFLPLSVSHGGLDRVKLSLSGGQLLVESTKLFLLLSNLLLLFGQQHTQLILLIQDSL